MRVAIVGAGPAGLYSAIQLRLAFADAEIEIVERNPEDVTWGFGVVFSDTALDFLAGDDPDTHALILPQMQRWRDLTIDLHGQRITIDGIGFAAIGRLRLIQLLTRRARSLALEPRFGVALESIEKYADFDLVIGADGLNSLLRSSGEFGTSQRQMDNHFIWYGTRKPFATLTQTFRDSAYGRFNAHHYRYAADMSTFIVETDASTWQAAGFADLEESRTRAICEEIFADVLEGAPLVCNHSCWRTFPLLRNERWFDGNRVLLGDALHTAHFSIGSGTRLAMEDAIALVKALRENKQDIAAGLSAYQASRQPIVDKLVAAAGRSARWYEEFARHMDLPAWEFADAYIRRGGRIDDERLRALSPRFMAGLESYRAGS
ncbi:MAG: FAD-dependent monooxygenase [Gammaproteobacteria bacterium]|nr:FAD-dependent monooxygenase [Gammaproteobacteria bacterium]